MAKASRERFQVNVPLEDEHWHLVLLQLAIREGKSVPELLRPVVVRYLKRQMATDPKLAAAVLNMKESRSDARDRHRRQRDLAEVKPMALTKRRERRRSSGQGGGAASPTSKN